MAGIRRRRRRLAVNSDRTLQTAAPLTKRHAAGLPHAALDARGDFAKVRVARRELGKGVGDANHGPAVKDVVGQALVLHPRAVDEPVLVVFAKPVRGAVRLARRGRQRRAHARARRRLAAGARPTAQRTRAGKHGALQAQPRNCAAQICADIASRISALRGSGAGVGPAHGKCASIRVFLKQASVRRVGAASRALRRSRSTRCALACTVLGTVRSVGQRQCLSARASRWGSLLGAHYLKGGCCLSRSSLQGFEPARAPAASASARASRQASRRSAAPL